MQERVLWSLRGFVSALLTFLQGRVSCLPRDYGLVSQLCRSMFRDCFGSTVCFRISAGACFVVASGLLLGFLFLQGRVSCLFRD